MSDPELILTHLDSTARISARGGRVTQWRQLGREILFRSSLGSEHRGVPVLFPQFGNFGTGKFHGFVRDEDWTLLRESESEVIATLKSVDCREQYGTKAQFECRSRITLWQSSLRISLFITNRADEGELEFTAGLHTYLAVTNLEEAEIVGFQAAKYWDATDRLVACVDLAESVSLGGPLDRVYVNADLPVRLNDSNTETVIEQTGFEDIVIWNPGPDLGPSFEGLSKDEWRKFVCIEAAQIQNPVTLRPGETWTGSQTITVR